MADVTNRDKVLAELESYRRKVASKSREAHRASKKFKTLNVDYAKYKNTVRDIVDNETYERIIAELVKRSEG